MNENSEYLDNRIEGWLFPLELQWLYATAKTMKSIVEIGSWKGRSTHALCSGCKGIVTSVDHWAGSKGEEGTATCLDTEVAYRQFLENTKQFKNLSTFRMTSIEASKIGLLFDMVFIDGGHTYEEVLNDIRLWEPLARKILCGHDYSAAWPGVCRAVNEDIGKVEIFGTIWVKRINSGV